MLLLHTPRLFCLSYKSPLIFFAFPFACHGLEMLLASAFLVAGGALFLAMHTVLDIR
jgi:hypothetical protein